MIFFASILNKFQNARVSAPNFSGSSNFSLSEANSPLFNELKLKFEQIRRICSRRKLGTQAIDSKTDLASFSFRAGYFVSRVAEAPLFRLFYGVKSTGMCFLAPLSGTRIGGGPVKQPEKWIKRTLRETK